MRIRVQVNVSESIRRGNPSESTAIVEIGTEQLAQLTEQDRDDLAYGVRERHGTLAFDPPCYSGTVAEPTFAAVLAVAREVGAKRRAEAAKAAADEAEAARLLAEIDVQKLAEAYDARNGFLYGACSDALTSHLGRKVDIGVVQAAESLIERDKAVRDAVFDLYHQREKAENKRRNEEVEARDRQEQERKKKSQQEKEAWIAQHGSTRLKRMLAEKIELDAVYRDERLATDRPGWQWLSNLPGNTDDPRNPPESAFATLDEARKTDPDAYLQRYTVEHEHDEDCYDECPEFDESRYVAETRFLGRLIVFGL